MKFRILYFLFILFQTSIVLGQTIDFTYDANGNRIKRILTVEQLKSQSKSLPISDPEILNLPPEVLKNEDQSAKAGDSIAEDEEIQTNIYPNPSAGILNINIINRPLEANTELRLYDLSGTQLVIVKDFPAFYELNINNLKGGIYILSIRINQKLFDYKVIKEQK